jgi:uncharacterized protein (TIGR03084 family)
MAVDLAALADDLMAETAELEQLLTALDPSAWRTPTPAAGWQIHDQVSHLAYFDQAATRAALDPLLFRHELEAPRHDADAITERVRTQYHDLSPADLLAWFQDARSSMLRAFAKLAPSTRVPWYGPDMSLASCLTARIMETWAHGQDVADALGAHRNPTPALRQVAHLGVRTLANSSQVRGLPVPDTPVRTVLTAPDSTEWTWGPASVPDRVGGDAIEFCLVVTQRTHNDDTALVVEGPIAEQWMTIAQAFAGPPGQGRGPTSEAGQRG